MYWSRFVGIQYALRATRWTVFLRERPALRKCLKLGGDCLPTNHRIEHMQQPT
jgi:hypothetical protein